MSHSAEPSIYAFDHIIIIIIPLIYSSLSLFFVFFWAYRSAGFSAYDA